MALKIDSGHHDQLIKSNANQNKYNTYYNCVKACCFSTLNISDAVIEKDLRMEKENFLVIFFNSLEQGKAK